MKKVCIVTPDLVGPIKNGGVGTHVYHLSKELVKNGFDVTVLFTADCESESHKHWKQFYEEKGITYIHLTEETKVKNIWPDDWFMVRSYAVFLYLKNNDYDFVHFQDYLANGFHTIQAKKTMDLFDSTLITVTMHSPFQWVREGMQEWNPNPLYDMKLWYAERYCCENADLLISPSEHMFNWAIDHGWHLSENRYVVPNCYSNQNIDQVNKQIDFKHFIFFGRLEIRKGIELFCNTMEEIVKNGSMPINKITFLGKMGFVQGYDSKEYIEMRLKCYPIRINIITDYNAFQAMEYMREHNGIVVMPSLLDNYPYAIVECIQNGLAFITSNVGGIPELVDGRVLFEPNTKSLRDKILKLQELFSSPVQHKYNREIAALKWLKVHENQVEKNKHICDYIEYEKTLVSICVAYFNHGKFLPQLLQSINNNSYPNYEVIVVNDGSTDEESNIVFNDMEARYKYQNWHFYRKENEYLGKTRNFAANKARGKYIIFMDSDNAASSTMIEDFVFGMLKSGADCLTCHVHIFAGDVLPGEKTMPLRYWMPLGAALELGYFENVFGDANFIIKKEVFDVLEGFTIDRLAYEDWEFLAKLSLKGFKQEVIPKSIFYYRLLENSMARTSNHYESLHRVLRAYYEELPIYMRFLIDGGLLPFNYNQYGLVNGFCSVNAGSLYPKLIQKLDKLFPKGSKRRELVKIIGKKLLSRNKFLG